MLASPTIARALSLPEAISWRITWFAIPLAIAWVHMLDAAIIHPQVHASWLEHVLHVSLAAWGPPALLVLYGRLSRGWKGLLCIAVGLLAGLVGGVLHLAGVIRNDEWVRSDYTGVAMIPAGIVLLVVGLVLVTLAPHRLRYRFVVAPIALMGALVLGEIVGGTLFITHVPRYVIHPVDLGAPYEDVSFQSEDGLTLRGWYVPSKNGAAVAVMHGSGGSRVRVADYARMLIRNGYGVLLFDVRGHGQSQGGTIATGWNATSDPAAAARFLASRADVDPSRIGLLGSSMGAEIAVTAAATYDGFAAVVADGAGGRTYDDFLDSEYSRANVVLYTVVGLPLEWAVSGLSQTMPPPSLTSLAPKIDVPILYIASGTVTEEETIVRKLWQRTGGDSELWVVEGAGHTEGLKKHPVEYEAKVVGFFDRYLAAE